MQISRAMYEAAINRWASSFGMFATGDDSPKLHAVGNNFAPSLDLVVGDLTLLDAKFSAVVDTDNLVHGYDPETGEYGARFLEHADNTYGFMLISNAVGTPFSVYGFALLDADSLLLAVSKLQNPLTITRVAELVEMTDIGFRIPASAFR